ncbi:gliding motility-associated C-terminal domain-containing protein [Runella salmonicolor]|uniref:Gliding motility-associated C-terminal domain-containing protein n=1 Tax=Runella salmonicolor TaxID=2950278 RepID=A0ABT1FPK7_9BACT|nr:gliding motility-associated C-terminal domain-containing protein [Runella salmonicolor]MCP1383662.1 gliding motility-associated C-terminal domain-containing protein [Runella salmonicolor]
MKLRSASYLVVIAVLFSYHSSATAQENCDNLAAPTISCQKQVSCAGQPVVLKATGCDGTVEWSTKKTGATLTVYPTQTTTFQAVCLKGACKSKASNELAITVSTPATPVVEATKTKLCFGDSVKLTTKGCAGEVIWSNGMVGKEIIIYPVATTKYTATCRTEGCVSCFADDIIIAVMGGEPLRLKASQPTICEGQSTILSATGNCAGQIKWSTTETGSAITVKPNHTPEYWARCETDGCEPVKSTLIIQVAPPKPPVLTSTKSAVCVGESLTITAEGCSGIVKWNTKMEGQTITVSPTETTTYSAVCEQGTCQSNFSSPIIIYTKGSIPAKPLTVPKLRNECPYTTVDLSSAITVKAVTGVYHEAHTGDSPTSPLVAEVGAIAESRTFYLFARSKEGCYSEATPVKTIINACQNALPLCSTNPATAAIAKAELTTAGNYSLEGKIGGIAATGQWKTNGTGVFNTSVGLSVIYTPSPEDRQAGKVSIHFSSDDPDGEGPCKAGVDVKELEIKAVPSSTKEIIGVNKLVKGWSQLSAQLFEIEYAIQIVNMGNNELKRVELIDSLDKVFKNGPIIVGKPIVKAVDFVSAFTIDTAYTGQNGHYNLLTPDSGSLLSGQTYSVTIKTVINTANAKDSLFYNTAYVRAQDVNGNFCADKSTNGNWPDLNQNEDPTDDSVPTVVALNTLKDAGLDLFFPEGFSPNSDGINDFFVVKKPIGLTALLEVYNRWGGLVYRNEDYKNDWNGGIDSQNNIPTGTYFYIIRLSDGREFSKFLTINR